MENMSKKSLKDKLIFYLTAFFILLGTFSLFSFLFLVPFVIEPAYTTLTMNFDCNPVRCTTIQSEYKQGASNCSWSSCREGCTKDIFDCTQIIVTYRNYSKKRRPLFKRGLKDYQDLDYDDQLTAVGRAAVASASFSDYDRISHTKNVSSIISNTQNFFIEARLFPNVKGCGYPPTLNCSKFFYNYTKIGTEFACFYSRINPNFVITDFNIDDVYLNLIYALALPIPAFIFSLLYLVYAYFNIYQLDTDRRALIYHQQHHHPVQDPDADTDANENAIDCDNSVNINSHECGNHDADKTTSGDCNACGNSS